MHVREKKNKYEKLIRTTDVLLCRVVRQFSNNSLDAFSNRFSTSAVFCFSVFPIYVNTLVV